MSWHTFFRVVLTVWLIAWVFYGTKHWIDVVRESRREGKLATKDLFPTVVLAYVFHLFVWPGALFADLEEYIPRIGIAVKLRPAWSLLREDEEFEKTWTLKSGVQLHASARGFGVREPCRIWAECDADAIQFRLRMVAPRSEAPTDWKRLRRMSESRWAQEIEEEDLTEKRPFEIDDLRLQRGRYVVEFRVENDGAFEEMSGIPLVIY